jgi:hypothetical protein
MDMTRREAFAALLVVASFAVPAAAKDLAAGMRGNWNVDQLSMLEASAPPFYKMATPEKKKEYQADMLKSMPAMSVEITATTATMKAGTDAPQVATYTVARQEKSTVWIALVPQTKGAPAGKAEKYSMEFVDADTLKMTKEGDPGGLLLKRSK